MSLSTNIKEQLHYISDKIDEAIKQYRQPKEPESTFKPKEEDKLKESSPHYINKINSLKSQIDLLQKNLEDVYIIDKVNSMESDIKKKEKTKKNLQHEQVTLNNVLKMQTKSINEYMAKFSTTKELKLLSEQLKKVKEAYHNNKEKCNKSYNTIRIQKNKIDTLEKRCHIIKQNIEFYKRKQMKEVQNNSKDNKKKEEEEENEEEDFAKMEEAEKKLINEINEEEKKYRIEINEQNDIAKNLTGEIKNLVFKIKILQQEKKMEEIKKKNMARRRSLTKYQSSISTSNISKIPKYLQNRSSMRHLSHCINCYYKNQKSHSPSPNNIGIKWVQNSVGKDGISTSTKPFEIKKFNDFSNHLRRDSNDEKKNNTTFNDNNKIKLMSFNYSSNNNYGNYGTNGSTARTNYNGMLIKMKNKGLSTLKEIENLKSQIQDLLANNILVFNKNGEIINKNSAYQTMRLGNRTNGITKLKEKEEDTRSDSGYYNANNKIDDRKSVMSQNKPRINDINDKISEENYKRKPFDKIIFK